MHCDIYKSSRKTDTYLFVEQNAEIGDLPASLVELLGNLEHVMALELHPQRILAQADATDVIKNINSNGYYVQMPPAAGHPLDRMDNPC
ncbi:MAG: YcgL domain-containing protein [marine bacterium B5-7]|nr:MAG: YcgL domain-containing protein [marine bacterium B5-7]